MESADPFPGSFQTTSYEANCFMMPVFDSCAWAVHGHTTNIAAIQHGIESFHRVFELIMIAVISPRFEAKTPFTFLRLMLNAMRNLQLRPAYGNSGNENSPLGYRKSHAIHKFLSA
jgi:hypothetical protein